MYTCILYSEWGPSFNYIHASAAVVQYSKKAGRGSPKGAGAELLDMLMHTWLQRLPCAEERQCANVLWALGRLGKGPNNVWAPTFTKYVRLVQEGIQAKSGNPQELANVVWACARLRQQPKPDQLQVLIQAMCLPEVLAAATEQALSNIIWALGKLCKLPPKVA
jgi:hypothetical protein